MTAIVPQFASLRLLQFDSLSLLHLDPECGAGKQNRQDIRSDILPVV